MLLQPVQYMLQYLHFLDRLKSHAHLVVSIIEVIWYVETNRPELAALQQH